MYASGHARPSRFRRFAPMAHMVHLPNDNDRLTVVGRTGSGKTVAALWHLSRQRLDRRPTLIYDFKGDSGIAALPAAEIALDGMPGDKGLYVVRPLPEDADAVDEQLRKVWKRGDIGLYIDEGYMVAQSDALNAILTQGRSRKIPVILLSQRPVSISRFAFSEADYYQVFHLNDIRDRKTVGAFAPVDMDRRLPAYHSWYYDVKRDVVALFKPVPDVDSIVETIEELVNPNSRRKVVVL